jgi:adenosine deaminase
LSVSFNNKPDPNQVLGLFHEFSELPKVDLHRHLEGSLRLNTIIELAGKLDAERTLPANLLSLRGLVQIQRDDNLTFENFLAKFNTLRLFYRSPEVIERITCEAIEDAARDNIQHLELRFTPVALSQAERFPLNDVMDWVCESAIKSALRNNITVRLIASVNRHESIELAEQVVWLSIDRLEKGIAAIDLAGNEAHFPAVPFLALFNEARQSGLKTTIHAGEWGPAGNVREAIETFSADRIGHGIRILEDPTTIALARERNIPFEVCITSNYQTGVVNELSEHPAAKMIECGLNVTFNTDDPSISQITLSDEYRVAQEVLKIPLEVIQQRILAGARASFLPDAEKNKLVARLRIALQGLVSNSTQPDTQ